MSASAIRTTGLTKHFGRVVALDDLTISVEQGEIFGFLGPNGAGKSTTIRLLLGLLRATSGTAEVMGIPVTDVVRSHQHLAHEAGDAVPQQVQGFLVTDHAGLSEKASWMASMLPVRLAS